MIGAPLDRHQFVPIDYLETMLAGAQVTAIPAAKLPDGDLAVIVHYQGGPFRFTLHGFAPTGTFGWPADDGDADDLNRYEAAQWRACLAAGATSGTVRVGIYQRRR